MTGNLNDPIGQHIAHYLIGRRIGGGAMASVYQATDEILDRTIALKVLLPGADVLTRQRFRQEARTVSILDHPHIVRTLQVGQTSADGVAYIAMDLVKGKSLSTLLDERSTLPIPVACALLEPVARALAYAHSLGVVHRDVKPSNILLRQVDGGSEDAIPIYPGDSENYIPYLSDFGIARALDSPELTSAGRTIGTPAYMAPEQCAGSREIDGRADIYSLGTVLYRCLVGRPPFIGTTTQILHAHVYEPLMIPDDVLRELPPAVIEALRRTLMKEPEYRYKDASEMADTLATVIQEYDSAVSPYNSAKISNAYRSDELAPTHTIPLVSTSEAGAREDSGSTSHVLVQAPSSAGDKKGTSTQTPVFVKVQSGSTTHQRVVRPLPQETKRQTNWIGIALGATLLLLLAFIGIALVRTLNSSITPVVETLITPAPMATGPVDTEFTGSVATSGESETSPTQMSTGASTSTSVSGSNSAATPSQDAATPDETTAVKVTSTQPATPTPSDGVGGQLASDDKTGEPDRDEPNSGASATVESSTPTFAADSWFDDALYFFERREWGSAREQLVYLARTDSSYMPDRVQSMLAQSYIGLGVRGLVNTPLGETITDEQFRQALNLYSSALELNTVLPGLQSLVNGIDEYVSASTTQKIAARTALIADLVSYSERLAANDSCAAMEQLTVALRLEFDQTLADRQKALAGECPVLEWLVLSPPEDVALTGSIIYSAVAPGGDSQIWRVSVVDEAESEQIIANGRLPALSPDGTIIAYRSDSPDQLGIQGFGLLANQTVGQENTVQLTYNAEDSLNSPPTWSSDGVQFFFESTVSADRVSRLYFANNNPSGQYRLIADGREPNGHPTANLIVFKGADSTGNRPGLWVMNSAGGERRSLTDNPGDTRPVWSPDGRYVVFMNNTRNDGWDVYRVDNESGEVLRLTSNPADDGLPTVSPNGRDVAFLTNRNGPWEIYVVPIEGGAEQAITTISGILPNWLEHSIQWVK